MKACVRCGEWAPARSRFCGSCGASLADAPVVSERRKHVTVVFADVVGSTALGERVDPETLRWAMQRWFECMRDVIERHGGIVEKYIGDAVLAVFGFPVAHEDDALRAVRAAAEMRDEVAALRSELCSQRGVELAVRIGVNTGEAVTGAAPDGGVFTAGDMVNVAARLEQAASAHEVLLGRETLRLVAHAAHAEPVAPLTVKGKSAAVEAFRLLTVLPEASGRPQRLRAPLVGRADERRRLQDAFEQTVADRTIRLVTVLGAAGVGKSRLVHEAVETMKGAATVAHGRCRPYGEGSTWSPLAKALGGDLFDQVAADEDPPFARAAEVLKPAGARVAPEDAFWALRTVLEMLARRRPLVLVMDDLQWAEPTLMDLLEHVVDVASDAPLLIVALARRELLDVRPDWCAGRRNAAEIALEPLAAAEAGQLLQHLIGAAQIGAGAATRILDVAGGFPLFLEEVVAMIADDGLLRAGDAPLELPDIAVPATLQSLLAARLDRLEPGERAVVEAASVEGKEFTAQRVERLLNGDGPEAVAVRLRALVRKDLVETAGEYAFRFAHQLLRDAAYEGMSKRRRADLHERLANTLDPVDELLGTHLERTVLLRRELGESGAATAALATKAIASLSAAGRRASQRVDPTAASGLFERAVALAGSDVGARGRLLPLLGSALFEAGRMDEAARVLDEAIASAPDRRLCSLARIEREFVRLETDTSGGTDSARRVAAEVLPFLKRAGDHYGQCRALCLCAQADWIAGQVGRADAAWVNAAGHARQAGDERELFDIFAWRATASVYGPLPVNDAIELCEQLRERVADSPVTVAYMVNPLATLHAMRGEFDLAERRLDEANSILRQLGALSASVSHHEASVWLLAGRPDRAEASLRAGIERLEPLSAGGLLATSRAMLAEALYALGRLEEARAQCAAAADAAAPDDLFTQAIWRGVEAKILARAGERERAEALAREAVALLAPTDELWQHGNALLDLSEVLERFRCMDEADDAARAALALYEQKGNLAAAARARSPAANQSRRT